VTREHRLAREMAANISREIRDRGITHLGFLLHREENNRVEIAA
jgi:hypothetical protein